MAAGIPEADDGDDEASRVFVTPDREHIQLFDPETQQTIR